jgi:hypothetical protein
MGTCWVEANCPEHGFERFQIKIATAFNIHSYEIRPKYRTKPRPELKEVSCLLVGRYVTPKQIENYLTQYFKDIGIYGNIIRTRLFL